MNLNEMRRGATYEHKTWGKVVLIASHPHDGAGLIVQRDLDEYDGDEYKLCEASDLVRVVELPHEASPLFYPAEFTPTLRLILGHMCFQLANYCHLYRAAGFEIATKAEDEQAFMLDKMLRAHMTHGPDWIKAINDEREELQKQIEEREKQPKKPLQFGE